MKEQDIHLRIIAEYGRATRLHPKWPKNKYEALAIIMEEVGELAQAILDAEYRNADPENIKTEAIQVGAMIIRFLVNLKR